MRFLGLIPLLATLLGASVLRAEPAPGDVFREHVWRHTGKGAWQRITWPGVKDDRAKAFLPNAVNTIELADVKSASRIEVQLELLQSHHGTIGQAIRINGGDWIPIPPPAHIPGNLGSEPGHASSWLTMRYPTVSLPVTAVVNGRNTFEFTCEPGKGLGEWWPQSIVYAAVFRVYYDEYKPAPVAKLSVLNETPSRKGTLTLQAQPLAPPERAIRRVDFVAHYRGYDWRGEGLYERWHYHTEFGQLRRHLGTAHYSPWRINWDVRWVPAQDRPIRICARVEDDSGMIRMSEPITLQSFQGRPDVRLFTARNIPPHWQTRNGQRDSCTIDLPSELPPVAEAKLILATWNGFQADEIGYNGNVLLRNVGLNHDLSYDEVTVPVSLVRPGANEFHTHSTTKHHGIEVLWPGAVLLIRYAPPPEVPHS